MTSLVAMIAIAGWVFFQYPGQASFAPWKQSSDLEKRAVAETQRIFAQELDPELPRLPFSTWFKQVVGPQAGTVWQLSECGETAGAKSNPAGDIRACVEANSILPDGRKVFVVIAVGTFKKGMTGAPAFHSCVVEQVGNLRPVRRLRDLPKQISAPGRVELPEVNLPSIRFAANKVYLSVTAPENGEEIGWPRKIEEPPPEPPPNRPQSSPNRPQSSPPSLKEPQSIQQVVDKVLEGNAITRVEPIYPPTARMIGAFGTVRVQITISETGSVIDAKAISGHEALRSAAVAAAYKWVFKPTTFNGEPIKVQGILTFNFRSGP